MLLVLIVQMVQVSVSGHVFVFATVFVIVHEGESGAAVSSMLAVVRTPVVAVIHVAVAVVTGTVVIVDVGVDMTVSVELGVLNIVSSSVGPPLRTVLGTAGVADETVECYAIVVKILAAV